MSFTPEEDFQFLVRYERNQDQERNEYENVWLCKCNGRLLGTILARNTDRLGDYPVSVLLNNAGRWIVGEHIFFSRVLNVQYSRVMGTDLRISVVSCIHCGTKIGFKMLSAPVPALEPANVPAAGPADVPVVEPADVPAADVRQGIRLGRGRGRSQWGQGRPHLQVQHPQIYPPWWIPHMVGLDRRRVDGILIPRQ